MRTTKLVLAVLSATILLSITAGSAVALRSISVSSTSIVTQGSETFAGSNGINIICALTLTGTLNRSIPKTRGATIGGITRVDPVGTGRRPCRTNVLVAAEIVAVLTLPWTLVYNSILGTLPRITGALVTAQRFRLLIEVAGQRCLYEGDWPALGVVEAGGALTTLTGLRNTLTLVRELPLTTAECAGAFEYRGEQRVTTTPRLTLV
jgi:hypothetical protein